MITGAAVEDVAVSDGLKRFVVAMQYPAPGAPQSSVFTDLEYLATFPLFNFRSTLAGFFLQFDLQIGDIFFKTNDPLLGHDG
jgi:hypothetical protein